MGYCNHQLTQSLYSYNYYNVLDAAGSQILYVYII